MESRRGLLACAALLAAVSAGRFEMRVPGARVPPRVTLHVPSGARQLLRFYGGERDVDEQAEATGLAPPRDLKVRVLPTLVVVTWSDPVHEAGPAGADKSKRFYTVRYRQMTPAAPWYYQTAMVPRVIITHVAPGTHYEISARVSEGEKDGPWCTPVMTRTYARAHPEEDHSISSANQQTERRGLRPSEWTHKKALPGRGERLQQRRRNEKVTPTQRRTEAHGANPGPPPLMEFPAPTTGPNPAQPDGSTGHLWLIDTEQNLLFTKDGNVVYDDKGLPIRLCVAEDGHTIISEARQPVLTRAGTLVAGFNGRAAGGENKTVPSHSESEGGLLRRTAPAVALAPGSEFIDGDEGSVSDGVAVGYGTAPRATEEGAADGSPPSEPRVKLLKKEAGSLCSISDALEQIQNHLETKKNIQLSRTFRYLRDTKIEESSGKVTIAGTMGAQPIEPIVVAVEGCPSFVVLEWSPEEMPPGETDTGSAAGYVVQVANSSGMNQHRWLTAGFTNSSFLHVENLQPNEKYFFKVKIDSQSKPEVSSNIVTFVTGSESKEVTDKSAGVSSVWTPFAFHADPGAPSACVGKRYVKRTLQNKLVGVSLCNSLRYKIYLGEDLRGTFYALGDADGRGEDHCEFVDSPWDGKTGPLQPLDNLASIDGYHRSKRQQRLTRGVLGPESGLYHADWYECGVAIPGSW
ncbi:fibronectin type III domain-containing protein 1-like isoform X1 [Lethenteron reissneri]|uniref:fibronectin type III domain-containing protein 1-like isoform X1 n=1 Tax=Lethenteron reissneri TaxID=7753 RepID=UPI002AB5F7FB|nr:fibronectin type III domain-containing protein 1-like isoform X1 [Lethenteron reissneri]